MTCVKVHKAVRPITSKLSRTTGKTVPLWLRDVLNRERQEFGSVAAWRYNSTIRLEWR